MWVINVSIFFAYGMSFAGYMVWCIYHGGDV